MQYVENSMYNTPNSFHRIFRGIVHQTESNIENIRSKSDKLTPFKNIDRSTYISKQKRHVRLIKNVIQNATLTLFIANTSMTI